MSKLSIPFRVASAQAELVYETDAENLSQTDRDLIAAGLRETVNNHVNTLHARVAADPEDTRAGLSLEEKRQAAEEKLAEIVAGEHSFGGGGGKADPFTAAFREVVIERLAKFGKMTKKAARDIVTKHGPRTAWLAFYLERKHHIPRADSYNDVAAMNAAEAEAALANVMEAVNSIVALKAGDDTDPFTID